MIKISKNQYERFLKVAIIGGIINALTVWFFNNEFILFKIIKLPYLALNGFIFAFLFIIITLFIAKNVKFLTATSLGGVLLGSFDFFRGEIILAPISLLFFVISFVIGFAFIWVSVNFEKLLFREQKVLVKTSFMVN